LPLSNEVEVGEHGQNASKAFTSGLLINTCCSPILEMSAYAFAAQSLIAPFGGLDTVWNALLAPYTLGEELTERRIQGVVIIITGTVASAFFASTDDKVF